MRPVHLTKLCLALFLGSSSFFLASCHKATSSRMSVRRFQPSGEEVDPNAPIRVVFSYRVAMSSVDSRTFRVEDDTNGALNGSFSYNDETRTVTFWPATPFAAGVEVTVTLSSSIRSTTGASISRASFRFRVAPATDPDPDDNGETPPDEEQISPPAAIRIDPAPFSNDVAPDRVIEIQFSDFLNPFAVGTDSVAVVGDISGPVPVRLEGLLQTGDTLRIIPLRPYARGERVRVSILAGLVGLSGGIFPGDTFSFRVSAEPLAGDTRASISVATRGRVHQLLTVDLDGDGIAEIVFSTENGTVVDILRYVGDGAFDTIFSLDALETILSIAAGDVDNDGDIDLLVGLDDRLASVLNETPAGSELDLLWGDDTVTRSGVRGVIVTELDHRQPPDLILDTDTGIQIVRDGIGSSPTQRIGTSRRARTPLVDADLNGDGHLDLAYGESLGRRIAYHLGSASGDLGPATTVTLDGEIEALDINDYDGDGNADLLALLLLDSAHPRSPFRLLTRDPDSGEFPSIETATAAATTLESMRFATGDLDGNGTLDLLLADSNANEVQLFDSPTPGDTFPIDAPERIASLPEPTELRVADLGGDERLDIVIASGNELRVLLSEGNSAPPPPPPSPPAAAPTFELRAPVLTVRQGGSALRALLTLSNSVALDGTSVVIGFDPLVVSNPSFDPTGTVLEGADFSAATLHEEDNAISYHAILELLPPFDGRVVPAGTDQELLRLFFDVPADAPLGESELSFPASVGSPSVMNSIYVDGEEHLPDLVHGTIIVEETTTSPPSDSPDRLRIGSATVASGGRVRVPVIATSEREIEAFSVIVSYPGANLEVLDLPLEGSSTLPLEPEMIVPTIVPEGGYFAFSVLFDLLPPYEGVALPADESHVLFSIDLRVADDAPAGDHALTLVDGFGDPPLENIFSDQGRSYYPSFEHGVITVDNSSSPTFVRGDANGDSEVNAADSIFLLNWVFHTGGRPGCMDAADVNDDGEVNVADSTWIIDYTMNGGSLPPLSPFPNPGTDPSTDALDCVTPLSG